MKIGCTARFITGSVILMLCIGVADAQITLDGSMGTAGSLAGPNFVIPSTVGQTRGSNLFHSFGLFNVLTNQSATFTGPNSISNIFGRVTGGQPSTIDGQIRSTIPNTNLYLMNPAGMLFGPNALLDVQGSFHATTADYLKLADGAKFHADLARQSVLTTVPVSAFGFLSANPAGISVQASSLQVPGGQTLSLIGGNLLLDGATVRAPTGQIVFANAASPVELPVNVQETNLSALGDLGQIYLLNSTLLDASGNGGGAVVIRGGQLTMVTSSISANNTGNIDGSGIGVNLAVAKDITILNGSSITTDSLGSGRARDLQIAANNVSATTGALIRSSSFGSGNGGTVRVTATDTIALNAPNGSAVTGIFANAETGGTGAAGNIIVETKNLSVSSGAVANVFIRSDTSGPGNAGTVHVTASETINLDNGGIAARSLEGSSGDAGNVLVEAKNLTVANGSRIRTGTFGSGNGGTVQVTADAINLDTNSEISARALAMSSGNGGDLTIQTKNLTVTGGAFIGSEAFGSGKGGTVTVIAADAITVAGTSTGAASRSGISTSTTGVGVGGDMELTAHRINLGDNAVIASTSSSSGRAGNISLTAQEFRSFNSAVTTTATFADGGNINFRVGAIFELVNSQISATVGNGFGSGGNIVIDPTFVILNNSQITANAFGGPGGNIKITADNFLASPDSAITASSAQSTPGTVNIQAPITDLSGSLAPLPESVLQEKSLLPQACALRFSSGKVSSLVVASRHGLPLEPSGFMLSPLSKSEILTAQSSKGTAQTIDAELRAPVTARFSINGGCS